jgi:hypothetical protein
MLKVYFRRDKEESAVIYEDRLLTGERLKTKIYLFIFSVHYNTFAGHQQILIGTFVDNRLGKES